MMNRRKRVSGSAFRNTLATASLAITLAAVGGFTLADEAKANEVQKFSSRVAKSSTKANGLALRRSSSLLRLRQLCDGWSRGCV